MTTNVLLIEPPRMDLNPISDPKVEADPWFLVWTFKAFVNPLGYPGVVTDLGQKC